jgi:hypothetical protein
MMGFWLYGLINFIHIDYANQGRCVIIIVTQNPF